MKKLLLLCALLLVILLPVFSENKMPSDSDIQAAANSLGVPFTDLKNFVSKYYVNSDINTPDIYLKGFDAIYSFYDENEKNSLAFFQKYENKCIQFYSVPVYEVGSFSKYDNGYDLKSACQDSTTGRVYWIYFYVSKTEEAKLASISKGSWITIQGFIKRQSINVYVYDAIITNIW